MKVFIDPGHNPSGGDTGAQGNGLREQDVTYQIGSKLAQLLQAKGADVKLSRPTVTSSVGTTVTESINGRVKMANDWGADYFVSIHCNAAAAVSANGTETLVYGKSGKAYELARAVNARMAGLGLTDRGVKERPDLGVLRGTNMPAILVETAFISNTSDAWLLCERPGDIARAILDGICEYLGLEVERMAKVTFIGSGKNIKAAVDGRTIADSSLVEYNGKTVCLGVADFLRALGHEVEWKAE